MEVDFFDPQYVKEPPRTDPEFGICDKDGISFTLTDGDPDKWVAVVHNETQAECQYVPVDHNIVVRNKRGEERSMCDGMLYKTDLSWLSFIELKEVRKGWKSKPLEQLESTVQVFLASHDPNSFGHRFAYAVNRRHPRFAYSRKEEMQTFRNKYGFSLLFQRDIIVL